jgi:hypothetical protein
MVNKMKDLAIISTYFNPRNYNSRKKNTDAFLKYIEESGVSDHLYIAEIIYPNQESFIKHKNTIYLKCESPVWNKEAALNAIVKRLPPHYTKVMWVDLDVMWTKENWYNDISKLLDSYKIIQPFSKCIYLNNDSSISKIGVGYFNTVKNNISEDRVCYGMTMAYTREFCDKFGFFDKFLLGAGDTILAMPAAGQIEDFISFSRGFCFDDVWDDALKYAENISNYVNGNYTFYDEEITHLFHGALDFMVKKKLLKNLKI